MMCPALLNPSTGDLLLKVFMVAPPVVEHETCYGEPSNSYVSVPPSLKQTAGKHSVAKVLTVEDEQNLSEVKMSYIEKVISTCLVDFLQ